MNQATRIFAQALLYAAFAAVVGYFATAPVYRHLPADQALIKLSFSHSGKLLAECRQRSAEELAKMPPNMRAPMDCRRERSPVAVEIDLDGQPLFRHIAPPSGLSKDGVSTVYQRFTLPAGTHQLAVRFSDDVNKKDFGYQRAETVTLAPGKVLVIDFDAEKGGITLI